MSANAFGQEKTLTIEIISSEMGLSNGDVYCVFQDSKGFLWIGTQDGLNRYDGYEFRVFRHEPGNPNSLSDYAINKIIEDPLLPGVLWIATREGLNRYDPTKETFIRFRHDPGRRSSLSNNRVREIYFSRDSVLWVGTDNGLNRFNREEQTFEVYLRDPQDPDMLPFGVIGTIIDDDDGNLWIGGKGLAILDVKTGEITYFRQDPADPYQLSQNVVTELYKDRNGNLWIGTRQQLVRINRKAQRERGGSLLRFCYDPAVLENQWPLYLKTILEDQQGTLWLGSLSGGLLAFDPHTESFTRYKLADESSPGDSPLPVRSLFEDRSGILWIGTGGLGLVKCDRTRKPFETYRRAKDNPNALVANDVTAICEDRQGVWWIGTSAGLSRVDESSGGIRHFQHDPTEPRSLSSNNIQSIYEDRRGNLWIGTWGGGLNKLDRTTWRFSQYRAQATDTRSLSNDFIHAIYEDRNGSLWIGTGAGGLERFDYGTGVFTHYARDPARSEWLQSYEINCILEDRSGLLWLGTTMWGLYSFDPKLEKFTNYMHELDSPNSLSSNRVISVYEDKSGTIWAGTFGGGLNRYDRNTKSFRHFTEKEGLPGNSTHGILEDDHGNLWLSTNRGLSRFDAKTLSSRNFYTFDGLPSNEFQFTAFRCSDGKMLFGSNNGLLHFYPDSIRDNPFVPPVVLTDFAVFNEPVRIALNEGELIDKPTLEKSIGETDQVLLSYDQNVLTFEFAALHFAAPLKNKYAYKLEGFDRDWNLAGNRRMATYTNLEHGEYTFRVRGSNSDGIWNEEGTSVQIVIHPPWWRTTLAYVGYVVLGMGLLYGFRRFEMNRVRIRNQLRMQELEAQKLQELDRAKSRFFANISHEFRTPLTLILGPLQDVMEKVGDGRVRESVGMMQRNASRLLRLINELLDLSRLESGRMTLHARRGDLIGFLKGIVYSFASLADQHGISLHLAADEVGGPMPEAYFDSDKLEKIIVNLLSNAFKFTPDGGEIEVGVRPTGDGVVTITVSNTGEGISGEHLSRIFDRFYQVDNASTRRHQGTGIGLALTKELVELQHGTVTARSEAGGRTEFEIRLPIARKHFSHQEIKDEIPWEDSETDTSSAATIMEALPITKPESVTVSFPVREETGGEEGTSVILLVEDHEEVRQFIREHLGPECRVLEAGNGREGLNVAMEEIPDLIISDVMMPEMDGFALCQALKADEKTSHIPVILLTARAGEESRIEGFQTGADDYLAKPFSPRELQVRVANLIQSRRELRKRFSSEMLLQPRGVVVTSASAAFLTRVMDVIEAHLGDEKFGVQTLSEKIGMTQRQLSRKLNALADQAPNEFIRSFRLHRSRQLIEQEAGTVSEIAYRVGFNSLSYFSKCFKDQFGVLPSELKAGADQV